MKKISSILLDTEKSKKILIFPIVLVVLYFSFMLRFYLIDYYVPDFRLYASFAQTEFPAKDGFSSLFIFMSGLAAFMPKFMTLLCLVMLAASIFCLCFFCYQRFWVDNNTFCFMVVAIFLCGSWFYFYGKIFYDFPFSVFSFTMALLAFSKFIDSTNDNRWWNVTCLILGFSLSWKPYNIFMLAGFGCLCMCYDDFRILLTKRIFHFRSILLSFLFFLLGFLAGNYNFFTDPAGTLKGIRGYKACSSLLYFFVQKNRVIWDHVNYLPFNLSVYSLPCMAVLLLILPIFAKKLRYIVCGLFMMACLCIFIKFFSAGYTWHGFTFGIFLILEFCFLLKEDGKNKKHLNFKIATLCIFVIQTIIMFGYYVPKQAQWHNLTQKSLAILEKNAGKIYNDVINLAAKNEIPDYVVECAVYRYKPVATNFVAFKKRPLKKNLYIAPKNIYFGNALEAGDFFTWKNYFDNQNNPAKYVIWIIPNAFKIMGDVANIHLHDAHVLVDSLIKDEYSVYIYEK